MRPLIGYPLFPIVISTFAVGVILKGVVTYFWGYDYHPVPPLFGTRVMRLEYFSLTSMNLGIIVVTSILVILLFLFFSYTKLGTALRATSEDVIASYISGIPVKRIFWLSWVIVGVIGGMAGVCVTPITFLNPQTGFIGLSAFPAAVLGGFESIPGSLIGGIVLGILEMLASGYLPESIKFIFPWVALYLILLIRPEGFFGKFEKVRKV
jgi:branched-chain amino acid transport system permease protein